MNEVLNEIFDYLDKLDGNDIASESFNVDVTACRYFYKTIYPKYQATWREITNCNDPKQRLKLLWDLKTMLVEARQYVVGLIYHPILATLEFLLLAGVTLGLSVAILSGATILGGSMPIMAIGGISLAQWFIMLAQFLVSPSKTIQRYARMRSLTVMTHPNVGQDKVISQLNDWIRDIDSMIQQQQHTRYLDSYDTQVGATTNASMTYVKKTSKEIEAQSSTLVNRVQKMFGQLRTKLKDSDDPELQQLANESFVRDIPLDQLAASVDDYLTQIAIESFGESAMEADGDNYIPGTSNIKTLSIWFGKFKPRWHNLKKQLSDAKTPRDQKAVLWEQKKLILETRDEILRVPESQAMNIIFFVALVAVTLWLAVDVLEVTGVIGDTGIPTITKHFLKEGSAEVIAAADKVSSGFGNITSWSDVTTTWDDITGAANAVTNSLSKADKWAGGPLKLLAGGSLFMLCTKSIIAMIKYPQAIQQITGQTKSGIMSKQVCIQRLEGMRAKIDKKLEALSAGATFKINEKAKKKMESESTQGMNKLEQLLMAVKQKFSGGMESYSMSSDIFSAIEAFNNSWETSINTNATNPDNGAKNLVFTEKYSYA